MVKQLAGTDFSVSDQHAEDDAARQALTFEQHADQMEKLPLWFLRSYGSTGVGEVLDAMNYAVYVHDVTHIVLDNLQFMLSGQHRYVLHSSLVLMMCLRPALLPMSCSPCMYSAVRCHAYRGPDRYEQMDLAIGSTHATQGTEWPL